MNKTLIGTKGEVLSKLNDLGFNVPKVFYFSVKRWNQSNEKILNTIQQEFKNKVIVVRSSTISEDSDNESMAGTFDSVLNVHPNKTHILRAINQVIESYDDNLDNHVLIQPMVKNVIMSGVIMTRVLDDGSPYYVLNYDDKTGRTDTVTGGLGVNKTVYIFNGVKREDFDNPLLVKCLDLIKKIENLFPDIPLDIEFAIDIESKIYLLQLRKIIISQFWKKEIIKGVSKNIEFLKGFINDLMVPRNKLFGKKTLLGFMTDWNPAEMIGIIPRPLSKSLYRNLITKNNWRIGREKMGYRKMPNVELMISLFGRPYIDIRNSFNSFLPEGLNNDISEKLINACLERLEKYPFLHDKVEFEVIFTVCDFEFENDFKNRYPNLLSDTEFKEYHLKLKKLTFQIINGDTLDNALSDINILLKKQTQKKDTLNNSFDISDKISTLLTECSDFGTLPFSILARHGFIAESIIQSILKKGLLTKDRIDEFKKSIRTISGEMSLDYISVNNGDMSKSEYLNKYGHLRPSSYDILSPNYNNRTDIFEGLIDKNSSIKEESFHLTTSEKESITLLIKNHWDSKITVHKLFKYLEDSIKGREYGKFIFTRHLSEILELIPEWGKLIGLDREDLSYLEINQILDHSYKPIKSKYFNYYSNLVKKGIEDFELSQSFKLSYLIRSDRDTHIIPMQRSHPNFIGGVRIEKEIIFLSAYTKNIGSLENKIVCIEGADPGYDWIFTHNIAGLITKFGGANSHMSIKCSEFGIPAAIGCGEQTFSRIINSTICLLDCQGKRLQPIKYNS